MKILGDFPEAYRPMLERLGEMCQADEIEYRDLGKSEIYTIRARGLVWKLQAHGNAFDGGFLSLMEVGQ